MRKRFWGSLILGAAVLLGTLGIKQEAYATDTAAAKEASEETAESEGGQTALSMLVEEQEDASWDDIEEVTPELLGDGMFTIEAKVEGDGEGSIESPATMTISAGVGKVLIVWDSDRYEYMEVNGEKYEPLKNEDTSTFEITVPVLNKGIELTVGSEAEESSWEETYTLTFDLDSMEKERLSPRILGLVLGVVIGIVAVFLVIKLDQKHEKKKAAANNPAVKKDTNKYRK